MQLPLRGLDRPTMPIPLCCLRVVQCVMLLLALTSGSLTHAQVGEKALADAVPMHRGNAGRTGVHPGPGPSASPDVAWKIHLGDLIVSSPIVADGRVYVGSVSPTIPAGGALHALDLYTGEELWRFDLDRGDGILSTPAVVNGVLYVATYDGVVFAVEAATGREVWQVVLEAPVYYSALAVNETSVFVGDTGGHLYALSAADGQRQWTTSIGTGNSWSMGTAAVADDHVFVVAFPGRVEESPVLIALNAQTGEEQWNFVARDDDMVRGIPMAADDRVYVSTTGGSVYALESSNGSVSWEFGSERDVSATSPALVDGQLVVGTNDGQLHIIDVDTGDRLSNFPTMDGDGFGAPPTIADRVVYSVNTVGDLHAVDLDTGKELWAIGTDSLGSSPVIIDGLVVIGDEYGFLLAFG